MLIFQMEISLLIGLVVMTLMSTMAHPVMNYQPEMYHDYQPVAEQLDYYHPYAAQVQSRSFYDNDYYQPFEQDQNRMRGNYGYYEDFNQDEIDGNAPITFIPAKNNGAFAGPLAVVPGKLQGSGKPGNQYTTEYLPIIGAPNWPFIEKGSQLGRSSLPLYYQPDSDRQPLPFQPFLFPFYYLYRY